MNPWIRGSQLPKHHCYSPFARNSGPNAVDYHEEMRRAFEPDDPDELMAREFADPKSPLGADEDYRNEDE